jgi:hypothetical protein
MINHYRITDVKSFVKLGPDRLRAGHRYASQRGVRSSELRRRHQRLSESG